MNWKPPGFAHGRVAGGGSYCEERLRGFRCYKLRNFPLNGVRVGGGAHQEGRRRSPLLSSRFDHFPPAVAGPDAQTTRTTPSGRAGRPTSVHLDFHLLLGRLVFLPKHTHSTPLLSPLLLHLQTRNGEIGLSEREIAFREIDCVIGSQQIGGEEREWVEEGREKKKTLEIQ